MEMAILAIASVLPSFPSCLLSSSHKSWEARRFFLPVFSLDEPITLHDMGFPEGVGPKATATATSGGTPSTVTVDATVSPSFERQLQTIDCSFMLSSIWKRQLPSPVAIGAIFAFGCAMAFLNMAPSDARAAVACVHLSKGSFHSVGLKLRPTTPT
jgi:hypothetical protein